MKSAGATAFSLFVDMPVKETVQIARENGIRSPLEVRTPYIKSTSPEGSLISKIRDEGLEEVAFFAFIFINRQRRDFSIGVPELANAMKSLRFDYERSTAFFIINNFYNLEILSLSGGKESVYAAAAGFSSELINLELEAKKRVEDVNVISASAGDGFKREIGVIRRGLKRRKRVWSSVVRDTVRDAKERIGAATSHLDSAKDAYSAQIDLKASVEYWNERKLSHQQAKKLSLINVLVSMFLTLAVMYCYYEFVVFPTPAEIPTQSPVGNPASTSGLTSQEIISLVAHLFGAALLLTFMGILVRMALRQYNTHSNCAMEAQERVTFTKTYLALMHEGKLTGESDRKLVLESLFRPNSFSNSSEITFTTPIEMIYKAAEKVRP